MRLILSLSLTWLPYSSITEGLKALRPQSNSSLFLPQFSPLFVFCSFCILQTVDSSEASLKFELCIHSCPGFIIHQYVPVRAKKKKLSNREPETTTQAVPSLSRAHTCVAVRAKKKKTFKQPHRPFLRSRKRRLDWDIVLFLNAQKKSRNYQNTVSHHYPEVRTL